MNLHHPGFVLREGKAKVLRSVTPVVLRGKRHNLWKGQVNCKSTCNSPVFRGTIGYSAIIVRRNETGKKETRR